MKKFKGVIGFTIVLSLVMAVVLVLAGCAQKEETQGEATAAPPKATPAATAAATKAPLEPVNLVYYVAAANFIDGPKVQDAFNKITQEKINATVTLKFVPFGEYDQKLSVAIASGEEFDLMFTANWLNNYYVNIAKGALLPLEDLLAQYAPNTKASIPDTTWEAARVKGFLYGVINQQIFPTQTAFAFPQEVADKYQFDLGSVQKMADFEPVLAAVKQNEPENDFITNPIHVPYLSSFFRWDDLASGFGVPGVVNPDVTPIEVFNQFETQEFKDTIALYADWYKKGYLPKDYLTRTNWDYTKMYLAITGTYKPGGEGEISGGIPRVQVPIGKAMLTTSSITATMTGISATSKNPERAMMLLELLNTDRDLFNLIKFGIEGEHYKKTGDNTVELIADSKYNSGPSGWAYGSEFNSYLMTGQPTNVWEETKKINDSVAPSVALGFILDVEPIKTEIANVNAVWGEYDKAFRSGSLPDLDKSYNEFIDKLKQAGADKIIAEKQKQLDAWVASK